MRAPDAATAAHRCGRVALFGRPNVGKSSLLNALLDYELSIVAPKAQTTRHRVLGILTRPGVQIAFVDTPGLHDAGSRAINRLMNRVARGATEGIDAALMVAEAGIWRAGDDAVLALLSDAGTPVLLALNKVDRLRDKRRLLPMLDQLAGRHDFAAIVPVSATRREGLEALLAALKPLLPEAPPAWDELAITDRSERFLAAERVREQLVLQLRDELPYETTVEVEGFEDDGELLRITASIWVARPGQKAIVIGAGGAQLKRIGSAARRALERQFDRKVFLALAVRLRERWADDDAALRRFGYVD